MDVVLDLAAVPTAEAPLLDAAQRRVVDHRGGPLLVLAGPGTGKTTTLVEAIVSRLHDPVAPLSPDQVLGLTFGRKAAGELRDRVLARVGGGMVPIISTFHSFAYALLRTMSTPEDFLDPPRLLSGAEEDARIRELLQGAQEDNSIAWPDDLRDGLRTMGFAQEVRAVLARATELQISGEDLVRIGRDSDRPAWAAVGQLAMQMEGVEGFRRAFDYSGLLVEVSGDLQIRASRGEFVGGFKAIFVDEYQDTDPMQVRMLKGLCGPDTSLIAVGDPDQSIYAFRGADRSGIIDFPHQFTAPDGSPAPVVVLDRTRRFGPRMRAAATRVMSADPLVYPDGAGGNLAARHRTPVTDPRDASSDLVQVLSYDSESALAGHVADELMRAHLHDGLAWNDMAIIVRAAHQIEPLMRALAVTGVPVGVAPDEVPLHTEPAVAVLVSALKAASHLDKLTSVACRDLLIGPLGGVDPADLRPVARALRARFRAEHPETPAPSSDELIRGALLDPRLLDGLDAAPDSRGVIGIRSLSDVLHRVAAQAPKARPVEVLWTLWDGTSWPQRLKARALAGNASARHDLDCVMALFDTAERASSRASHIGLTSFWSNLEAQQIPAEQITERGAPTDCVRVLSAHRSKGLEWEFVVIVGAQETQWPDLRPRGSVLQADRLTREGIGPAPHIGQMLDEERRLFYVACTRARSRLLVAVVDAPDHAASNAAPPPSRFAYDLAGTGDGLTSTWSAGADVDARHVEGRRTRGRSLSGLVASLRTALQDPRSTPALRHAAAQRLAELAQETSADGRPLVPAAHPDSWWGVLATTEGVDPVRPEDEPVSLSASALERIITCPLRWYLDREAGVEVRKNASMAFGSVVHTIAERVATGEVEPDLDEMCRLLDEVWSEIDFDTEWQREAQREAAKEALARFLVYHQRGDRDLIDTEAEFTIDLPFGEGSVDTTARVHGFLDRIERDAEGRIVPIDFKTAKDTSGKAEDHVQLQVYQYAIEQGAFAQYGDVPGGGALVQLRKSPKGSDGPLEQWQSAMTPDSDMESTVVANFTTAVHVVRSEQFDAVKGDECRMCSFRKTCPIQIEPVI